VRGGCLLGGAAGLAVTARCALTGAVAGDVQEPEAWAHVDERFGDELLDLLVVES